MTLWRAPLQPLQANSIPPHHVLRARASLTQSGSPGKTCAPPAAPAPLGWAARPAAVCLLAGSLQVCLLAGSLQAPASRVTRPTASPARSNPWPGNGPDVRRHTTSSARRAQADAGEIVEQPWCRCAKLSNERAPTRALRLMLFACDCACVVRAAGATAERVVANTAARPLSSAPARPRAPPLMRLITLLRLKARQGKARHHRGPFSPIDGMDSVLPMTHRQ
jgi:hypothetical protein